MIFDTPTIEDAAGRALMRELQSAHFYTPHGEPRYERDDGKPVTLREARKENLFPSITHIFNVLGNRPLTIYREKQLLAASFNLRPREGELDDDYFARVLAKAREDAKGAADVGTETHAGIEAILKRERWDTDNPRLVIADKWIQENVELVHWQEEILVDESMGLAGRCDALLRIKGVGNAVVDWKTRRFKELKSGWKCNWYNKDGRQIAFYAACVERGLEAIGLGGEVAAINVAINTKAISPVEVKEWTTAERANALERVCEINSIWQDENNYKPPLGDGHYYLGIPMPAE